MTPEVLTRELRTILARLEPENTLYAAKSLRTTG